MDESPCPAADLSTPQSGPATAHAPATSPCSHPAPEARLIRLSLHATGICLSFADYPSWRNRPAQQRYAETERLFKELGYNQHSITATPGHYRGIEPEKLTGYGLHTAIRAVELSDVLDTLDDSIKPQYLELEVASFYIKYPAIIGRVLTKLLSSIGKGAAIAGRKVWSLTSSLFGLAINSGKVAYAAASTAVRGTLRWMLAKYRFGQKALSAFWKRFAERLTPKVDAPASTWTRPPNWQGPAASRGTWVGQEGNSVFRLNNATADAFGVPRGTQVRFVEGVPDFSPFVRPTPTGTSGVFEVPGLIGVHATDQPLIRAFLADQGGTTPAAVTRYLRANDLRMHHFRGNTVQLVPDNIHQLHHTGGAAALRGLE